MPMIEVYVPGGALAPEVAAELLEELARLLLHWEGAPDTEFFREVTWVYLHHTPQVAVGGRAGGAPRFRVEVSVPEGLLSTRRKTGLIRDVHTAVAEAAGMGDQPSTAMHVWTLIREVPEGNWGVGGVPIHFAGLRQHPAAERERPMATAP